jgi:hypothetical protein
MQQLNQVKDINIIAKTADAETKQDKGHNHYS